MVIFFAERLLGAFAVHKLQKFAVYLDMKYIPKVNVLLNNDVISFEQLGSGSYPTVY